MNPEPRLVAGDLVAEGERGSYRAVAAGPTEVHVLRRDLGGSAASAGGRSAARRSLARIGHVTDLQLADVQSPGRFEFFEALRGRPGTSSFLPAQRPQEALLPHAFDSLVRRLESLDLDLVVSTGDNLDNAQWNELGWYLRLLCGGEVDAGGGRRYEGVQAAEWPGELFWHPDGGRDRWRQLYGYPTVPGLLDEAMRPFAAAGLSVPWLSCYGNHDGLAFGEAIPTARYQSVLLSGHKPTALPPDLPDPLTLEATLFQHPEIFTGGPGRDVAAVPGRRIVDRREFVAAHVRAPGLPIAHGLSEDNVRTATAYFSYDLGPEVRVVVLDTTNLDGWHEGSLGAAQFAWLEAQLTRSSSRFLSEAGEWVAAGGEDRLVVLASHHGSGTMSNLRQLEGGTGLEGDHPRFGADRLQRLLARFPNVVAWLNGHRHVNEIATRPRPTGGGYVEITTCAVADWPSQARVVELVLNDDGSLSIVTTMVDHAGSGLAGLHRELAGNVPGAGFGSWLEGRRDDRNCEVVLEAPFALD